MFKDKVLLITGGTGSFGNAVLRRFLNSDIREVRIFSRDEKKQDDMRHELQNPKVKFYIGNVRDRQSVDGVMDGVDYIFHAAAVLCASGDNINSRCVNAAVAKDVSKFRNIPFYAIKCTCK